MKIKYLLFFLVYFAAHMLSAQTTPESDAADYFIGHPMLADKGYKAESGVWALNIAGQGSIQNVDNMTDYDPLNYASTINLAHATVALDQIVRVVPDPSTGITAPKYGGGTEVGFVIAPNGSAGGNILNLDVIRMMVIYFYNGSERVASVVAGNTEESGLLNLNVIDVSPAGQQKISAVAPLTDKDGSPLEFDGIGFGFAGVQADVLNELKLYYAFIDDFVNVPIIHKYFPKATASVSGMVTGGKNLVNNKLTDGATTAVLNLGGAYYTVMTCPVGGAGLQPEQLEKCLIKNGSEIGFVISSGSVLDLNLGKALRIHALDVNGDIIQTATSVTVVGLELAGGGKTKVSMIVNSDTPCYGVKLDRISVADVDLGATVVHYAYVREETMRRVDYPFVAYIDVIPASTLASGAKNIIRLRNDTQTPLSTGSSVWETHPIHMGLNRSSVVLMLARDNGSDAKVFRYIWIYEKNGGYEYDCATSYSSLSSISTGPLSVGADGALDLSPIMLDDIAETAPAEHTSYYLLYDKEVYGSSCTQNREVSDNSYELSSDEVTVPRLRPLIEIAGTYTREQLDDNGGEASRFSVSGVSADKAPRLYDYYVSARVPEQIDYKTVPVAYGVEYDGSDFSADIAGADFNNGEADLYLGRISPEYTKPLLSSSAEFKAKTVTSTLSSALTSDYIAYLTELYGKTFADEMAAASREYSMPAVSTAEPQLPDLIFDGAELLLSFDEAGTPSRKFLSKWDISYNDAAANHVRGENARSAANSNLFHNWYGEVSAGSDPTASVVKHVTFNTANDGSDAVEPAAYTDENGALTSSNRVLAVSDPSLDVPVRYRSKVRAYIPVSPSATPGENVTYILADGDSGVGSIDKNILTGVADIAADPTAEPEYYNLHGVRVLDPAPGIYIVRRGSVVTKTVVR